MIAVLTKKGVSCCKEGKLEGTGRDHTYVGLAGSILSVRGGRSGRTACDVLKDFT